MVDLKRFNPVASALIVATCVLGLMVRMSGLDFVPKTLLTLACGFLYFTAFSFEGWRTNPPDYEEIYKEKFGKEAK